jgi:hypothetical protein
MEGTLVSVKPGTGSLRAELSGKIQGMWLNIQMTKVLVETTQCELWTQLAEVETPVWCRGSRITAACVYSIRAPWDHICQGPYTAGRNDPFAGKRLRPEKQVEEMKKKADSTSHVLWLLIQEHYYKLQDWVLLQDYQRDLSMTSSWRKF